MTTANVLRCVRSAASQDVAGIAAATGLHPNTVRRHLDHLVRDGAVVEVTERSGRVGRPRRAYRAVPPLDRSFERLARLLLALRLAGDDAPVEVGRRAGAGEALDAPDAIAAVIEVTAAHGFAPRIDGCDVVLDDCPFAPLLDLDRCTVCDLHLGLAQGAAARHGASVALTATDPCHFSITPQGEEPTDGSDPR